MSTSWLTERDWPAATLDMDARLAFHCKTSPDRHYVYILTNRWFYNTPIFTCFETWSDFSSDSPAGNYVRVDKNLPLLWFEQLT